MRNKILSLLSLALGGLVLTGCISSPRIKQLESVSAKEAIVVAKFQVVYNDKNLTKGCNVIFNNKQQFILDESGYVFARLPVGANSIRNLIHKSGLMQHHFKPDYLTCQLRGDGVINYIGDISFNWHGMGKTAGVGVVALFGAIGSSVMTGGGAAVIVDSNVAAAQEAFRQKFASDKPLTPALLVVKPNQ